MWGLWDITVSFMQIYTRLPVKVKVFTVPVKVLVNHYAMSFYP